MRAEFQVNLKTSKNATSRKQLHKSITKEPVIRQYLVLAEQVKQVRAERPERSMREIAKWLGYSPARLSQIFKLTFLAPSVKEEILLSDSDKIRSATMTSLCNIANESNWENQMEIWQNITL